MMPIEKQPQSLAQSSPSLADTKRREQMHAAWKAYRGEFDPPLKVKRGQPDDNAISNRCAGIVNKGVSFLFGSVLQIEPGEAEGNEAIQAYLNGFWGDDDDRMTLLSQLAMNGAVCGQAFLKLLPPQQGQKYPRLVVLDPLLVRVVAAPEDCSLILAYIIEYPASDGLQKRQIIARVDPNHDTINRYELDDIWVIYSYVRNGNMGSWIQLEEPEIWSYPFPPIFSCQNLPNPNEIWGMPDLTPDLINMNKLLNFVQSNISRILRFHAHPKTYASGITASQIDISVDELICLPNPEARLQNVEMQSDLSSSLSFASVLRSDMDEQSRVPAVALGRLSEMPRGDVSGIALQLMFQPLLEKTIQKRRLYGRLIRDVSRAALILGGLIPVEVYEDFPINLHWQDLLPVDTLKMAQEGLVLKQLGVSDATILQRLGFNPDEEREKSRAEDELKMLLYARGQGFPPAAEQQQGGASPQQSQNGQEREEDSPFIGRKRSRTPSASETRN